MKRPELVTIFAPSERPLAEVVRALLAALPDGDLGFTLRADYARISYDPEEGTYDFTDEQLGVIKGVDGLMTRLERDRGGMWHCFANLRFHATEIYVSHYYAQSDGSRLHTAVSTDSYVTRFLEDEAPGRGPYFAWLGRVAAALGAACFVSGVRLEGLRPLSTREVLSRAGFEATFGMSPHPYIIGWREQELDDDAVARGWGTDAGEIVRTLSGYAILSRLPPT